MAKISIKVASGIPGQFYYSEADVREDAVEDMVRHEGITKGPANQKAAIMTSETTVEEAAKREDPDAPERMAQVQTDSDREDADALKTAIKELAGTRRRTVKRGGRKVETTAKTRATR